MKIALLIAVLLAGCASLPNVSPQIGMTGEQVQKGTFMGMPAAINRTVTSAGVTEQWVYNYPNHKRVYLYFRNGRLYAWQD